MLSLQSFHALKITTCGKKFCIPSQNPCSALALTSTWLPTWTKNNIFNQRKTLKNAICLTARSSCQSHLFERHHKLFHHILVFQIKVRRIFFFFSILLVCSLQNRISHNCGSLLNLLLSGLKKDTSHSVHPWALKNWANTHGTLIFAIIWSTSTSLPCLSSPGEAKFSSCDWHQWHYS